MKKTILAFVSLLPSLVMGHHGISNFDLNADVAINGTIKDIAFVNPHSWIYVEVTAEDGSTSEWQCELRGSTVLRRSGWSKDMFEVGANVAITGSPDRFKDNTCYMGTIFFADGTSMNRYGQMDRVIVETEQEDRVSRRVPRLANGDPNINGDWAAEQGVMTDPRGISGAFLPLSLARNFEPGAVPVGGQAFPGARGTAVSLADNPVQSSWTRSSVVPLTEAGSLALLEFDPSSTDNPRLRCEPTNILFDWTFDTMVNQIVQTETEIRLNYGFMGLQRVIHLNETDFPENLRPSVSGYSIGRWQNDTLVVYTQGFLPGVLSADAATLHSDQLRVIERITLNSENGGLTRIYRAEDPLYFTRQYQGGDTIYVSDLAYETSTCDDRSYRSDIE